MNKFSTLSMFVFCFLGLSHFPAVAEPVYLSCTFLIDGNPNTLDFTADESAAQVSIFVPNSGRSRTVNATFTPDKVVINEEQVIWTISRTDLSITRYIKLVDSANSGKCDVQQVPTRVF